MERQPNGAKADRRILGDAQRAAKIEVAFRFHGRYTQTEFQSRGDRFQRYARTGHQRFEQHVART